MKQGKNRRHKKGSALLELALVIPIFMLISAGIFEFGSMLMIKHVITNAAREGARVGALDLDEAAAEVTATTTTQNYITAGGADLSLTTVAASHISPSGIDSIQVTVDYSYDTVLTYFIAGSPGNFTLSSVVVMRKEA